MEKNQLHFLQMCAKKAFTNLLESNHRVSPLHPYLFLRMGKKSVQNLSSNTFLRMNNKMSQGEVSFNHGYSFWSESQIQSPLFPKMAANSFITNPYKTQKFIQSSLLKGINKMVVDDVEQIKKIQMIYFDCVKNKCLNTISPEYLWAVEDYRQDLKTLEQLSYFSLQVAGLYFRKQYSLGEIKMFLSEAEKLNHPIKTLIKETSLAEYPEQKTLLEQLGIKAQINDYSQIDDYVMAARILGKDKCGNNIYSDEVYQYICSKSVCTCSQPIFPKIQISCSGSNWDLIRPQSLNMIPPELIINYQNTEMLQLANC